MGLLLPWYFCAFVALMVGSEGGLANGQYYRHVGNRRLPYQTFFVDQSGRGNFSTILSARDAVTPNNKFWICIRVKDGTYSFWLNLSLEQNTYNNPANKNPRAPAVAAMVKGDKSAFYRCGFYGVKDTLWDVQGRHYYQKCTIQSAIDFIFGAGQSLFELREEPVHMIQMGSCSRIALCMAVVQRTWEGHGGLFQSYIRQLKLFTRCRPKGMESRGRLCWQGVSSLKTLLTDHLKQQLTYAEHGCFGPGANTSQRVSWTKKLGEAELNLFTSTSYVDSQKRREGGSNRGPNARN
ncbi:putative pectinesterase 29 [Morella rubra]|uniref:pectinesterase n=1 Tax=Morella rubra TaxID=262757 RepID=A0A6A1VLU4_9ROSI|nr:putative pectinesterase 29 [Morella rubra]